MEKRITGLDEAGVAEAREKYGSNALVRQRSRGFFSRALESLFDPIIRVLLIAVIVEVVFTLGRVNWLEVGGILVAVVLATVVSTLSEMGSERAFAKIEAESINRRARVIRAGEVREIPEGEVVVGDILLLAQGEMACADGVMISGGVALDQSSLNGESAEVWKSPTGKGEGLGSGNEVFRGSLVTAGEGIVRVSRVGEATEYGRVARGVQTETRISPLKLRLSALASLISKIGYAVAVLVGIIYLFSSFVVDNGFSPSQILASIKNVPYLIATLSHALTLMITVIVVAVPEGLPMMITVVLSANMRSMVRDNVLVKKMVGIETAGSLNILFTDKTGTLTEGKSRLYTVITADGEYTSEIALRENKTAHLTLLQTARLTVDRATGGVENSTDRALSDFFKDKSCEGRVVSRIPFSSERKCSEITLDDGRRIIRGAPEMLLPLATLCVDIKGRLVPFRRSEIVGRLHSHTKRGERVIAVLEEISGEYVFVALCVMRDKLRSGVREAVDEIRRAGVQVVMMTGDSKETARAIAEECGILRSGTELVLTADELHAMSDGELLDILPRLRVISRALPEDKTRLVRVSQMKNLVVGMTGDGVNDAPSLRLADVGFAMQSGSEIAKEASDIVILDNSFGAIVKTALYGRTIFKSIRKFITFQLMMNLTACGVSLIGQLIGIDSPITVIQMLWINIIMDTLGGLAFAGEAPMHYYMNEPPKSREEPLLSRDMLYQILITGGYTLLLCVSFLCLDFFKGLFRPHPSDVYFMTGFLVLFVFSGIFNCLNARSERTSLFSNISKNRPFIFIMLAISVVQICMIYFGGEVFRCLPLTARELFSVILLSSSVIPFDFVRRIFKKLA